MELVVKPVTTDIRYRVIFKEPQFELIKQEPRISLLSKIMKNFDLHLNDIRFSDAAPSNNYLHQALPNHMWKNTIIADFLSRKLHLLKERSRK